MILRFYPCKFVNFNKKGRGGGAEHKEHVGIKVTLKYIVKVLDTLNRVPFIKLNPIFPTVKVMVLVI